jgi:hypothetical protein
MDRLSGIGAVAGGWAALCLVIVIVGGLFALAMVLRGAKPSERPELLRAMAELASALRSRGQAGKARTIRRLRATPGTKVDSGEGVTSTLTDTNEAA